MDGRTADLLSSSAHEREAERTSREHFPSSLGDTVATLINTRDMPRFYLTKQVQAYCTCSAVNLDNLKMQFDFYHAQIMEGDLETKFRTYGFSWGHMQIAGVPRRYERDSGEANYPYFLMLSIALSMLAGWAASIVRPEKRSTVWSGSVRSRGRFEK